MFQFFALFFEYGKLITTFNISGITFVLQHKNKQLNKTKKSNLLIDTLYFAANHYIKWLEDHDGTNHCEKPVDRDAKMER